MADQCESESALHFLDAKPAPMAQPTPAPMATPMAMSCHAAPIPAPTATPRLMPKPIDDPDRHVVFLFFGSVSINDSIVVLLLSISTFGQIENKAEGIAQITTRNGRVFIFHAATSRNQFFFRGLKVRDANLENRPIRRPFFDIEAERTGLKPDERFAFARDAQAEHGFVKTNRRVELVRLNNHIPRRIDFGFHAIF
jgi:hypothetical protein